MTSRTAGKKRLADDARRASLGFTDPDITP